MFKIKKKDKVKVICGEDKGKVGEVLKVLPKENRVIVSQVNLVKKHLRATPTEPGGIREIEAPIHISNVMLICPKCNQATRPRFGFTKEGEKMRFCRKCGEMMP